MSDYFDAYTAAVVSQFLEENDFDLENVEMPEFNIQDVQTNVPKQGNYPVCTHKNNFVKVKLISGVFFPFKIWRNNRLLLHMMS